MLLSVHSPLMGSLPSKMAKGLQTQCREFQHLAGIESIKLNQQCLALTTTRLSHRLVSIYIKKMHITRHFSQPWTNVLLAGFLCLDCSSQISRPDKIHQISWQQVPGLGPGTLGGDGQMKYRIQNILYQIVNILLWYNRLIYQKKLIQEKNASNHAMVCCMEQQVTLEVHSSLALN